LADILRDAWEIKKKQSAHITNSMIDKAMKVAFEHGAKAGKVSGAGGGGFIMFIVEPTKKKEVVEALGKLEGFTMPFSFTEGGAHGWKIFPTDNVQSMIYKK
jgi:D-glycero-alpha-D-manno-heptose-7-phosphate kinase